MDDRRDTRDTLAFGDGEQLHDGRVDPYFACCSSHCAGGGPLSEAMTAEDYLQVLICSSYIC